ncbi:hypothetical protein D8I24_5677 [Cupriavidus necator H850]|uniref:glycosyl hydrolase family 28-related protein n=1 Tax=Cupriavidus necator TaxID=106590 RepID=UPI001892C2C6|nr:glycosyl hydrolase family 28-related protein [Cupriavidus necator]KAI3598731.1 hypothetical protein D8I24_5677 [Cupriavidus necator H850]
MTINSATRKAGPFLGDGVTTVFPFSFKVFTKNDVQVTLTNAAGAETVLVLDSDYSVSVNADQTVNPGGTVAYPASLADGFKLTLTGALPNLQPTSLPNNGPFYPKTIEDTEDRAVILIQQLQEKVDRSIKVNVSDTPLTPLPTASARANMLLGFDAIGNVVVVPEPASIGSGDRTPYALVSGVDFAPGATSLTLPRAPGAPGNLEVNFDALPQDFTQWSVAGQTLTIPGGVPSGVTRVWGYIGTTLSTQIPPDGSVTDDSVAPGTRLYNRIYGLEIDARDYGVVADGVTDDTAAAQAAITAGGVNGRIKFPKGTILLSATLNALNSQSIIGQGVNSTIFRRFGDYGDTLEFASAGACTVRGIWFYHGTMPTAPFTALTNQITANPSSSHVRLVAAQGAVIEDIWAWRMPYQISLDTGSLVHVNRCNVQGVWDGLYSTATEGIAGIQIGGAGYIQLVYINSCYFGGSGNGPRDFTYSSSTGAHLLNALQNVGNQYGIVVNQCEGLVIDRSEFGGNWNSNIFANCAAGGTCVEWRISDNFFDGAGSQNTGACIYFTTQQNGTYATSVNIHGNHFNNELLAFQHIVAFNGVGTEPALCHFTISENTFQASVGSAMMFYNARGGTITGNVVSGYNSKNYGAASDLAFCCAAFFGSNAHNIQVRNNIAGGGVNTVAAPSYCYQDFYTFGTDGTVIAKDNLLAGGGSGGNSVGRIDKNVVFFTAAGNYQMLGYEDTVNVNKAVGGSTQVLPPANVPQGFEFTLKDGRGDAATNPVQFVGTVDGAANPIYNTNFFFRKLQWNGTQWNAVG